jgi:hypothetical protein
MYRGCAFSAFLGFVALLKCNNLHIFKGRFKFKSPVPLSAPAPTGCESELNGIHLRCSRGCRDMNAQCLALPLPFSDGLA